MATVVHPEEIYFGAPVSLIYGGVECGATVDPPKINFDVTKYEPEFQNTQGPIKGVSMITKVLVSVSVTVNEIVAQKLAWAMPGAASAPFGGGTVITWDPGRVPSTAYQTLVLVGPGLDGREIEFSLFNAMSAESQELDFSDAAVTGLALKFTGYYDPTTPRHVPFRIRLTDTAGS